MGNSDPEFAVVSLYPVVSRIGNAGRYLVDRLARRTPSILPGITISLKTASMPSFRFLPARTRHRATQRTGISELLKQSGAGDCHFWIVFDQKTVPAPSAQACPGPIIVGTLPDRGKQSVMVVPFPSMLSSVTVPPDW